MALPAEVVVDSAVSDAFALAADNPVLVVAAVVVAAAVLGGLAALVRRLRRSPAERFRRVLAGRESVAVLLHPNPDPDAMASGLAVKRVADDEGVDASLHYSGEIGHDENRAFETVLGVKVERIETADDLDGRGVVLVDHNEPRGFVGSETLRPVAVVDHHPGMGTGTEFTDVRDDYGACATILAEYLRGLDYRPDAPDRELTTQVATALLFGIHADTGRLTRGCSAAEFDAIEYLHDAVDAEMFDRISSPPVDSETLDIRARAISNREVDSPFLVTDVGAVSNVDAIPQAADELIRLEGINALVIMGRTDDTLHISGRSRDDRVHMGKTLEAVADEIPRAEAGGHARMGAGQLSLEHMAGIGPGDVADRDAFRERLFEAMHGEA